ncbi:GntG family PLP-dependent aldolase [Kitasatospora purpeofusca]|uniref:threonine aldolase family protein n=1 Tax=Kitasatospora purpeofusca TaxID=67352 RepID=UPI0030EFE401
MRQSRDVIADFRSDTMTRPTEGMLRRMVAAEVGDDCWGTDPTTRALEERCADLLGKEAALFTTSGTLSNQLALRVHTVPGDEVVLDASTHLVVYEGAQSADLGHVVFNTLGAEDGLVSPKDLEMVLGGRARGPAYAAPRLLCLENTVNWHAGRVLPLDDMRRLRSVSGAMGTATHLDGARLPNASVATGVSMAEYAATVDTVSVCFAKGLGAPFGSVLAGPADLIRAAKRFRKWYGGDLHQSGILAAAADYALDHHVDRLAEDHENAVLLAGLLGGNPLLKPDLHVPMTNIVVVDVTATGLTSEEFVAAAADLGVLLGDWRPGTVRAVTSMCVDAAAVRRAADRLNLLAHRATATV